MDDSSDELEIEIEEIEADSDESVEISDLLARTSLLGLLFSKEEIDQLLEKFPPVAIDQKQIIVREGEPSTELIVGIDADLAVVTSSLFNPELSEQNELRAGRAFNLYALLRGLPYQYSLKCSVTSQVLRLPWAFIQGHLEAKPKLLAYLLRVTEGAEFQSIAAEIRQAGCSAAFRIAFISTLQAKQHDRQVWLMSQNQVPSEALYLVRGDLLAISKSDRKKNATQSRWNVPARVWLFWNELAESKSSKFSLRSQTEVKFLSLSSADQRRLAEDFSDDFALWKSWLGRSNLSNRISDDEGSEKEIDLEEIFSENPHRRGKWLPYPWVQQNDMMDCGAACLAMMSLYYGKKFPIQHWRSQLSTDQSGTSLFDLCKTAERNGFISHALGAEDLDDIPKNTLPVIVLRKYHFLMLYAYDGKTATVGDPGVGVYKMKRAEFLDGFERVFVAMRPTEAFNDLEVPSKQKSGVWHLLSYFKFELAMAFLCAIMMVLASVIPPIVIQGVLDDVLGTNDLDLLKVCAIALASYVFFNAFMSWARNYFLQFVSIKLDFLAKSAFLQRLLSLPYSFVGSRHVGDFTRRLQEFETVRAFLTDKSLSFALSLVSLVIYLSILLFYSAKVAGAVFALAPIFVITSVLFTRRLISNYSDYFQAKSTEDGFVSDMIRGMLAIKVSGAELAMRRRTEQLMVTSLNSRYSFVQTSTLLNGLVVAQFELSKFSILALSVYLAIRGELTAGQVVAISMLVGEVLLPFQKMATHWADFQEAKLIINRLDDVFLTAPETSATGSGGHAPDKLTGTIEFRDVWFRYGGEGSDWILRGVTFKISAGEKVAVVGKSGSGKSTIALLINRTYVPQKGQILIDGRDHRDYELGWLRSKVGFVPQESFLFPGTVSENIRLPGGVWTDESVKTAADIADATDFINSKRNGFQQYIPAGGHGFSGGEKQRLSLARVLHSQPEIMVLDEATSSLDGVTERNFMTRLHSWGVGKTFVSIAHRLSTVMHSETILVMDEGRIVAHGRPEMLAIDSPLYRSLFNIDSEDGEESVENDDSAGDDDEVAA